MKRFFPVSTFWDGLLHLFYPGVCAGCGTVLLRNEKTICLNCFARLEFRTDINEEDNSVAKLFYGKVSIHHAMALFYYHKHALIQKLLFDLKYHQKPEIGWWLGKMLALQIRNSPLFKDINVLIPVPLHPRKMKKRGYNQAQVICEGMLEVLPDLKIETNVLVRSVFTETQTRKSTWQRFQNVREVFELKNAESIKNKHVLIVDDVITTGSTIEACAKKLLEIEGIKISVAAIASPA